MNTRALVFVLAWMCHWIFWDCLLQILVLEVAGRCEVVAGFKLPISVMRNQVH
jgi:hypothetical protein